MAGVAIMNIIGVVFGVIGIFQFGQELFPEKEAAASTVRIAVGLDSTGGLDNGGGHAEDNGKVADGVTAEIKVKQDSAQQATYGFLQAGNDAVCIAYVSITWPDGNQYAWSGDWGEACGGSWYYSNVYIRSSDYKPKCFWVDANGDQPQTGFQVHFPEFLSSGDKAPAEKDVKYFCNSKAPFQMFTTSKPQSIAYWNSDGKTTSSATVGKRDEGAASATRRSRRTTSLLGRRQTDTTGSQIVFTHAKDQSAAELCGSKTSRGPNLCNTAEKKFCRMSDKATFPLCDAATTDNCFNVDSKQLVVGGKATREAYSEFIDWIKPGETSTQRLGA